MTDTLDLLPYEIREYGHENEDGSLSICSLWKRLKYQNGYRNIPMNKEC